jgi:putative ABC transport system permease protein
VTDSVRQALNRLRAFFRKEPLDSDLDRETAAHLDLAIEENLQRGMPVEEARRQALVRFGGVEQAKEQHREARGLPALDIFIQDLRYAFRTLGRDPGFATVSILILALAIGANVAVFSVVNTLLLRPLPFPDSHQLVWIAPPPSGCGLSCATYSADAYEEFRAQSRAYQDVTGYFAFSTPDNLRLTGLAEPEPATSIEVIGNFFQVLGVQPAMGRVFTPDEVSGGPHPVAVLANSYWRRQFAADPGIVGKAIELNGTPVTVAGVLPASFDFGAVFSPGAKVDLFTPLDLDKERNWGNIVTLLGRLKPGVTVAQALDDAKRIASNIYFNVKYPETLGQYKGDLIPVPLKDYVTGKLRRSLIALWSAVGAILLIAGVNLSNLLLARAAARAKEFAVRGALGASRGRIVHQLLMESLLLSGAGAALGLGLALILIVWLAHQASLALPLLSTLRIDRQALSWTVLIAVFTAVIFGLLPGLRMASSNLQEVLKDSGPRAGLGRRHERVRAALVVSEVALACLLLVSAGLLLRSFLKVLDVDLGFQPDRAASIKVDYDDRGTSFDASAAKRAAIFQQILARVTALPGVEAAGMTDYLPLGPNREWDTPVPQGKTFAPGALPDPLVYVITPGFIRAMGIRLHGRDFTWADGPHSQKVVLINASAARVYWPGEDAVGKILMRDKEEDHVVGVVDDIHEENVEGPTGSQIYYPVTQQTPAGAQLVIRTSLPPAALAGSVLHALRELNPGQPATEFRPIRQIVDHAISPRRFFVILVSAFAALGLALASLGIYGVISYSVTRQTQEIGIRMALGATQGHVLLGVLTKTLRLTLVGIALGIVASFVVARLIASLLFGTTPTDPATFASMAALLCAVALIAGYVPARRASRIDPMVALRAE